MREANKVQPIYFKDQIINLQTVLCTLTLSGLLGEPLKKSFFIPQIKDVYLLVKIRLDGEANPPIATSVPLKN